MKQLLIIAFSMFLSFASCHNVSAQMIKEDVNVELSEPHKRVKSPTEWYVANDNYAVSVKLNTVNKITIQSFSTAKFNEVAVTEFDGIDSKSVTERLCVINNKFYIIYSEYDKLNNIESLLALEIDPLTANAKGDPTKLLSVNHKLEAEFVFQGSYGIGSKSFGKYKLEFSKDKQKLMVYYRFLPHERKDSESYAQIGIHVFNSDLEEDWSTSDNMKYTEEDFILLDYLVDSQGLVFILAKRKVPNNTEYSTLELLKYSKEEVGGELKNIPLKQINYIYSVSLEEKDSGQILVSGLSFSMQSKTEAFYIITIDKSDLAHEEYQFPIPQDVLLAYNSKREQKAILNEIEKAVEPKEGILLYLSQIIVDDAGSVLILAEEGYGGPRDYEIPGRHSQGTYHIKNIVVAKINSESEFEWAAVVPKYQYGMNGIGEMSYSSIFNEESLYLLYMDNENNLDLSIDAPAVKHIDGKGGFMTCARIDLSTGEIKKEHILDMRDVNGIEVSDMSTSGIVQLKKTRVAVELSKSKKEDVWIMIGLN